MKKEYKLIKSIKDLPFREWINDKIEVYVFENNGKIKAINGICPHYYGEIELDKKNKELKCNFHHLKICPKTLISNNKKFKKIQEFKIISSAPIVIEA